jgi:hypothetical protein
MDKNDFVAAAQALDASRTAPVDEEKRNLAPVKAGLLKLAGQCEAMAARVRPLGMAVQARITFARSRGVSIPHEVSQHLREGFGTETLPGLIDNAGRTCRLEAQRIEQLTSDDLYQGRQRFMANALTRTRPLVSALERLEAAFHRDLDLLTELVRRATPARPGVTVVEPLPGPAGPKVETRIEALDPMARLTR